MAELGITINAKDQASGVLKKMQGSIEATKKSIDRLTQVGALGLVIKTFELLRKAVGQNAEAGAKLEEITSGFSGVLNTLLMPVLDLLVSLWKSFGAETLLVANLLSNVLGAALGYIIASLKMVYAEGLAVVRIFKGDFKGAAAAYAEGLNGLADVGKNFVDKSKKNLQDYANGNLTIKKKISTDNKKAADEEKEIAYNSYTEWLQVQKLKQESIDAYNADLEEKQKAQYAAQKEREDREVENRIAADEKWKTSHADAINFINGLNDMLISSFGSAFSGIIQGQMTMKAAMIGIWNNIKNMVLKFIGEMIAKMLILKLLQSAVGFFPGGSFAGKFLGGAISHLGGQTNEGQARIIPGGRTQPIPIIAHGGEVLSRGMGAGVGGGLVINVSGSIYNSNETIEAIRRGLNTLRQDTGRGV